MLAPARAAVIIDLNSRLVVGCRLSNTADTESCLNALADACRVYGCPAIFHSDKGSQFTSRSFRSELRRRGITDFIRYYNCERRHGKLQGRTPAEAHGLSANIAGAQRAPSGC